MSYCVNCGVELDDSAEKCALCNTEVINPNGNNPDAVKPFPEKVMIPKTVRRRYAAYFASMIILIPNIVCLFINLTFDFGYLWAIYLNSSCGLLWLLTVFPFLLKKPKSSLIVSLDAIGIFLYTAVFYQFEHGRGWLFKLALPVIVVLAVFVISVCEWVKNKRLDWPVLVNSILLQVSVAALAIELIIRSYYKLSMLPLVSIIIAACCLALSIYFFCVLKNKRLRAWLSRKFFF